MTTFEQILPYLIPILIIELILAVIAILDLVKQQSLRGPKWMWVVIVCFVQIVGPILYFVLARKEE